MSVVQKLPTYRVWIYTIGCLLMIIQFIIHLFGTIGAYINKKMIVRLYWICMVPTIFLDLLNAVLWALRLQKVHIDYTEFLNDTMQQLTNGQ
ncbi:unnamed protein product [Dracunculus medinensis]|uniref:Transmembrane protein n=1 Tax=Dracunculus medinensis TaxID=318479 RepID=A0A0N4ULY4_DRAME|nr:unnamed protein product [Dracunculus medinensis]